MVVENCMKLKIPRESRGNLGHANKRVEDVKFIKGIDLVVQHLGI
jgi:hypothetical protein